MKDETLRIMRLVEQGKLSAEDALELLEAMDDGPKVDATTNADASAHAAPGETPPPQPEAQAADDSVKEEVKQQSKKAEEAFRGIFQEIEELGRSVAKNVNWSDISKQVNENVNRGVDAIKKAAEDAKKSGSFTGLFGHEVSKDVPLPFNVAEGRVFRIEGYNGHVKVVGTDGPGDVKVRGTFRGTSVADAEQKSAGFNPSLQEGDHTVVLRLPEGHDAHVYVEAHVPVGTAVETKLSRGGIEVSGLGANVRAETMSGDVTIVGAKGVVDVRVASGDVSLSDTDASLLTVESTNSDVSLTRVSGVINVRSGSGDLSLSEVAGRTISAETASGDISVLLSNPVMGSLDLRTVSGDVSVEMPDGSDCRVHLNTLRGTVNCGFALDGEQREANTVNGKLGSGAGSLHASAVSGDVSLGLRDSTVSESEATAESPS
ncbi:MAG: DUF4097 family beta strand repeat protein [Fimbriimonadaceae bacterium]|nr:DUF4097 family beta strand repeat protein [Fimbriimonadaceae bacterium]